ncbi:MAG: 3-dehydroquinate synthase [Ignavibacteriaceae bacterium]|nr:3-dehydroquinate synthase [Ignavibacteriaceae bacterium]
MKKLTIKTDSRKSQIFIAHDFLLSKIEKLIVEQKIQSLFIVIDSKVHKLYPHISEFLKTKTEKTSIYKFHSSEKNKSLSSIEKILSQLTKENFGRETWFMVIGGGIAGDVAGFAASIYMRGIKLIQVPTTLLSMVDSSVGGKTGINFLDRKNLVGTFYQPDFVIVDLMFLMTLSQREIICGLGEITKYGFLYDNGFYIFLKNNFESLIKKDFTLFERVVYQSIKIKKVVVEQDEKEQGIRKILNLGHTFAHALESELQFKVKHGEAVIAGLRASIFLSQIAGLIGEKDMHQLLSLPLKFSLKRSNFRINHDNLYKLMHSDKKNRDGKINLVLLKDVGEIIIDFQVSKEDVLKTLIFLDSTLL